MVMDRLEEDEGWERLYAVDVGGDGRTGDAEKLRVRTSLIRCPFMKEGMSRLLWDLS